MTWKLFNRTNNLVGWVVFAVAALTYLLTISSSASLWDCAEFIACDYKLEIGHPPGAPLYMLVYNVVSHLGGGPEHAALLTNVTSAVLSALTILFLFWTITHMVRRVLTPAAHLGKQGFEPEGQVMTLGQGITILASGAVGALVYTFSDSFWFSAVEAEVYAFSSFFTAVVFWLIFKWEERSEYERSDRWIILIAYLMGLSVGVHLLNLLCLPAMALVYYYRRAAKPTIKGAVLSLLGSFVLVAVMMYGIIQGIPKLAGRWDMFFVNTLGMSFNSGLYFYIALLSLILIWGIYETQRAYTQPALLGSHRLRIAVGLSLCLMGLPLLAGSVLIQVALAVGIFLVLYLYKKFTARSLHVLQMSLAAILVGFSTYGVILVRAEADPPMNENSPRDAFSLRYYLAREQYGSAPLLYGQTFASEYKRDEQGRPIFKDGEPTYGRAPKDKPTDPDRYVVRSKPSEPEYESSGMMLFPRVYDRGHAEMYNSWMGREAGDMSVPTFGENLTYFFNYQVNYMYWRYFLWNFAGRQNDLQGDGSMLRGGVMTGIPFVDALFYGDVDTLPTQMTDNKGHNVYYALPLILGLLGLFFQIGYGRKGTESFWVTFMLFFMTGLAIVLYLNQYPGQPRERDYAYVGSFYAFAIWVGFGVTALSVYFSKWLAKGDKKAKTSAAKDEEAQLSPRVAGVVGLVALLVPIQMAGQNWDDHDRSGRTVAADMGRNYLESCEPNGILFCYGDNDTFPLWYAQEVEGVRTDVRTINLSYLSGDWYIDQLKKQAYNGKPVPLGLLSKDYYYYVQYALNDPFYGDPDKYSEHPLSIQETLARLTKTDPGMPRSASFEMMTLAVDSAAVAPRYEKWFPGISQRIAPKLSYHARGRQYLDLGDLSVLDLIASNKNWERPIHWAITSPRTALDDLPSMMTQVGMTYQLLPAPNNGPIWNPERMWERVKTKFRWGGADRPGTYFDENARGIVGTLRYQVFVPLANAFIEKGDTAKAREVMNLCLRVIREDNVPYEAQAIYMADVLYRAGMTTEADHVLVSIVRPAMSLLAWAAQLSPAKLADVSGRGDLDQAFSVLQMAMQMEQQGQTKALRPYENQLKQLLQAYGVNQAQQQDQYGAAAEGYDSMSPEEKARYDSMMQEYLRGAAAQDSGAAGTSDSSK